MLHGKLHLNEESKEGLVQDYSVINVLKNDGEDDEYEQEDEEAKYSNNEILDETFQKEDMFNKVTNLQHYEIEVDERVNHRGS